MKCKECKSGITKEATNGLCGFCDGSVTAMILAGELPMPQKVGA